MTFPKLCDQAEQRLAQFGLERDAEMRTKLQKVTDPDNQTQWAVNPGMKVMWDHGCGFEHMMKMIALETSQYRTAESVVTTSKSATVTTNKKTAKPVEVVDVVEVIPDDDDEGMFAGGLFE